MDVNNLSNEIRILKIEKAYLQNQNENQTREICQLNREIGQLNREVGILNKSIEILKETNKELKKIPPKLSKCFYLINLK